VSGSGSVTAGEVRRDQLHTVLKTSCPQEAPFVSVYEPPTSVFDCVSGSDGYARGDILYVHTQVTRVTSISCSMGYKVRRGELPNLWMFADGSSVHV
jgi:hypothetical protein